MGAAASSIVMTLPFRLTFNSIYNDAAKELVKTRRHRKMERLGLTTKASISVGTSRLLPHALISLSGISGFIEGLGGRIRWEEDVCQAPKKGCVEENGKNELVGMNWLIANEMRPGRGYPLRTLYEEDLSSLALFLPAQKLSPALEISSSWLTLAGASQHLDGPRFDGR
ncbi:unnamed protein product [Caenorhabditis auriculariae]|uniref:Uncharacterized protein n=1 Tax=Caenorhabditis auriculariae TaxID=2777116 RepID=A0A8S1HFA3_9PELO|nr:unnamed protein product [Caenorhabditis auriculariae]